MNSLRCMSKNEDGFVLITAMVMLVLLTLLGIFALNTATFELKIAGNDRLNKQTFYKADAGMDFGSLLVEENLSCPSGFTPTNAAGDAELPGITVSTLDFSRPGISIPSANLANAYPTPTNRVAFIPAGEVVLPESNFIIGGVTEASSSSGLAMDAGYLSLGYSAASGGSKINYEIYAQNIGPLNSKSTVFIRWRHMIGMEDECNY